MIPLERNEIFLTLSLPFLSWGEEPALSFFELKDLLKLNLTRQDFQACQALFLIFDLENARAIWLENPLGLQGEFEEELLKTHLVDQEGFPPFVFSFLETYPDREERVAHFEELVKGYYNYLQSSSYSFIRWWGSFAEKAREAFVLFRSHEKGEDTDELYAPLESIFQDTKLSAAEFSESINRFLFDRVEQVLGENPFSLDRIFAYIIRYYLITLSLEKVPK